jgi:serine/threonine protein kinase
MMLILLQIFNKPEDYADMKAEVAIMQRLRGSPFVINIYESLEDKDQFVIVLELANGGDVMTRIEELVSRNDHFSEKVASRMFKQMLQAVKHCHDHSVVHRDLKPENFLMADKAADAAIKLTDFGLSALLPSPVALLDEGCGSAFYIAPEILLKRGYSKPVGACVRAQAGGAASGRLLRAIPAAHSTLRCTRPSVCRPVRARRYPVHHALRHGALRRRHEEGD